MLKKICKTSSPVINLLTNKLTKNPFYLYSLIRQEIGFTKQFENAITQKLNKKEKDSFLRLEISAGQGCEGFTYKFKFDNELKDSDYVYKVNSGKDNSQKIVFATNGQQMKLLKGATIDYAQQMMRQIFYVKQNPNAQISCSCKTSFSPKDYVF